MEDWLSGEGGKYIDYIKNSISDCEKGFSELDFQETDALIYNVDLLIACSIIQFGDRTNFKEEIISNVQALEHWPSDKLVPLIPDDYLSIFFNELIKSKEQEQKPTASPTVTKSLCSTALAFLSTPIGITIVGLTAICTLYFAGKSYFESMNDGIDR